MCGGSCSTARRCPRPRSRKPSRTAPGISPRPAYGIWLIREEHGTALVGTTGLRPLEDSGLEIFYSLAPGSWGKGYATEAARAVVEHALGPLGLPEVLAEVDEGNAASVAVVRRLGMTPFAVVPGVLGPMTRYRRTAKTEYRSRVAPPLNQAVTRREPKDKDDESRHPARHRSRARG